MSEDFIFEMENDLEEEGFPEGGQPQLRILVNNPVGPLPNMRLRYLPNEIVEAYEASAFRDAMRDRRGRAISRVGSMMVWLKRNQPHKVRPAHTGQVGLIDRFADRPYGMRK